MELLPMLDDPDLDRAIAAWQVIAALRHDELEAPEALRRWAEARPLGEDQRARLAQLCLDYGWRALLEELALAEPPGPLRDQMLVFLERGLPEPVFNDMGEPEGLYDLPGEDDADEEAP